MKLLNRSLLVLGIGCLAFLLWRVGLRQLWHELRLLGWGLIPFIALEVTAEGIHAQAWRYCLSSSHRRLSWFQIFRIRMAGYAINYLTPTAALGGEVTKAVLLNTHSRGPEAVSGVLLGKVFFAIGHLLFVLIGSMVIFWRVQLPAALLVAMVVSSVLISAGILAFLLLQKFGKLGALVRWLSGIKPDSHPLQTAARRITEVDEVLKAFYREHPRDLALAVCWHLLGNAVGILQAWTFFRMVDQPVSIATATAAFVLGMWFDLITFAVPLNVGALEASRIVALKSLGGTSVVGMTYGIALRLAQLFCAAFGLVSHAMLTSQNQQRGSPESKEQKPACSMKPFWLQ